MAKDEITWIKLVPSRFISDVELQLMSAAERGVAFWLWMLLYCNKGKLKCSSNALASQNDFDVKNIAMMCNSSENDVRNVVATKFQIKDGFIVSKKVDEVLSESQSRINKAVKAAKAKWGKQKSSNGQADAKDMLTHSPSNAKQTNKQTKKHNNINTKEKTAAFEEFWKNYPRKTGKPVAEKKFKSLKLTGQELEKLQAAVKNLAAQAEAGKFTGEKSPLQFCPNPLTWLNQGRYLDEPEPQGDNTPQGNQYGTHEATEAEIAELERQGLLL
jgi:uncharacterized protein YdaU (DUF1376 family)